MNWMDWAIIIILALGAARGYFQGLVKSFFMAAGWIIGLTSAVLYYQPLGEWLNSRFAWGSRLSLAVENMVSLPAIQIADFNPAIHMPQIIGDLRLPPALARVLIEQVSKLENLTLQVAFDTAGQFLGNMISRFFVNAVSFAIIVFAFKIVTDMLIGFLNHGLGIGGGSFDRMGGLLFGLLQSGLILAVLLALLAPLLALDTFREVSGVVSGSVWANWFIETFYSLL